jgi:pantoate--beta-alanine ligase
MSSRNMRLTLEEREKAPQISRTLRYMKENLKQLPFEDIKRNARKQLEDAGFQPDYIEIADANDLRLLEKPLAEGPMVILIAAKLGEIRLIDNMVTD